MIEWRMNMNSKNITILRCDGTEETKEVHNMGEVSRSIGAEYLDTVNLRDGTIMAVDDEGHRLGKAINTEATKLYHAVCKPGTTHQIVGDVAILIDLEWA